MIECSCGIPQINPDACDYCPSRPVAKTAGETPESPAMVRLRRLEEVARRAATSLVTETERVNAELARLTEALRYVRDRAFSARDRPRNLAQVVLDVYARADDALRETGR